MKKIITILLTLLCSMSVLIGNVLSVNAEAETFRYGETEVSTVVQVNYDSRIVYPDNQPSEGYICKPGNSLSVFVAQDSGPTVTFTVTYEYGAVNVSLAVGFAGASNGIIVGIPADGKPHKIYLKKSFTITRRKVDHYQYGVLQYTYYVNDVTTTTVEGGVTN